MDKQNKERSSTTHKILSIVGIVLCVILIPILIINCTLLIKGWTNKDEVPSIGSIAPLIVLTDSMSGNEKDSFDGGDLIFIKMIEAEEVKKGDVISFFDPQSNGSAVVSHRVVEIINEDGKLSFKTKGDNNPSEDTVAVPANKVIGVYTGFHIANAGHIAMFMQTTWGFVICVFVPVILLVGWDILRRKKYEKQHDADKEELLAELEELRKLKAAQSANKEQSADVVTADTTDKTDE